MLGDSRDFFDEHTTWRAGGYQRIRADNTSDRPHHEEPANELLPRSIEKCPRPESNQRTRFRKPLLYPLSYGGFWLV
jgi:hypothetical protein